MSKIVRVGASSAPKVAPPASTASGPSLALCGARMQSGGQIGSDVLTNRAGRPHAEYASAEHMLLGNAATNSEPITELRFKDGTTFSFGELVALSGDFIGSVEEFRALAATDVGQAELRWARWFSLGQGGPEPTVPAEAKKRALMRYVALVADNSNHFSHGGTAIATYERGHAEALRKAYEAGATGNEALFAAAVTDEACCQHFLSDAFAAGHVRAPVIEIRDFYRDKMGDSIKQVLKYAIKRLVENLDARGDVPWYWPRGLIQGKAMEAVKRAAGNAIDAFTLGDLVALACHNVDGKGLNVVSTLHHSGLPVPGGYHWHAVGDGELTPDSASWRMTLAAMKVSRTELDLVRAMGAKNEPMPEKFAATQFIPREDAGKNPELAWRWGSMNSYMVDALNKCIRENLVGLLRRYPPEYAIMRFDRLGNPDPEGAVVLHVGEAFQAFCREIDADPIKVVERAVRKRATAKTE